jgi:(p)ppGpp synthase/HD superfamily hydrolase
MSQVDVELAIVIATEYHAGQKDRAGQPYILHPLRVGAMGLTETTQIVGFLHDTLEDTDFTASGIRAHFGPEILEAVLSVTKKKDEPYDEYIRRASLNKIGHLAWRLLMPRQ